MKEQVKKYIDEHIIFEKYDSEKIKDDISKIVNEYTNIDKDSDNSCVITVQDENPNLRIGVFFKDKDDDNLKFKLHDWFITRGDVEFKELAEND